MIFIFARTKRDARRWARLNGWRLGEEAQWHNDFITLNMGSLSLRPRRSSAPAIAQFHELPNAFRPRRLFGAAFPLTRQHALQVAYGVSIGAPNWVPQDPPYDASLIPGWVTVTPEMLGAPNLRDRGELERWLQS